MFMGDSMFMSASIMTIKAIERRTSHSTNRNFLCPLVELQSVRAAQPLFRVHRGRPILTNRALPHRPTIAIHILIPVPSLGFETLGVHIELLDTTFCRLEVLQLSSIWFQGQYQSSGPRQRQRQKESHQAGLCTASRLPRPCTCTTINGTVLVSSSWAHPLFDIGASHFFI